MHPYEDEQFLKEHPEFREKAGRPRSSEPAYNPPSTPPVERRSSYGGASASQRNTPGDEKAMGVDQKGKKRGFFGKIKDSVIGTKEEREAEERARQERQRLAQERYVRQQELLRQQQQQRQQYGPPHSFGGYGGGYPGQQGGYAGPGYGAGPSGGGYYNAPSYGPPPMQTSRRGGGMGMGLPILGGLAGGLLLGDMLGGGFDGGDGGGFDGGDGGGGFDGGGGDGGGF